MTDVPEPAAIRETVEAALEALATAADRHGGLFPAMLDRESGEMLAHVPDNLPGQREFDRAPRGCNVILDVPTLQVMRAEPFADAFGAVAERYVDRWATTCTDTPTGLFPWGEHAYWDLHYGRIGNGYEFRVHGIKPTTHDHLRQAPAWFWELVYDANPAAVRRFANGLDLHYRAGREKLSRHAPIRENVRREAEADRAYDFPRHTGFYALDWAFAYVAERDPAWRARLEEIVDYWWNRRDLGVDGLLPSESKGRTDDPSDQTLSLANSLRDVAALLEVHDLAPDLSATCRERAAVYTDGFRATPHDPGNGQFFSDYEWDHVGADAASTDDLPPTTLWADAYGGAATPLVSVASRVQCAYRQTGEADLLDFAVAAGDQYADAAFPEGGVVGPGDAAVTQTGSAARTIGEDDAFPVRAGIVGLVLELYADLYEFTGDSRWRTEGLRLAGTVRDVFFDAPLPRGAGGVDHYENKLGTGDLLHGMARIALVDDDRAALEANYTDR